MEVLGAMGVFDQGEEWLEGGLLLLLFQLLLV